ncbi:MAG: hypothetical protein D6725_13145 [Planctomycetota bacterium]|nr:MAG: hypothetical protein D6725_13145 [Planctomycetota bacterium]
MSQVGKPDSRPVGGESLRWAEPPGRRHGPSGERKSSARSFAAAAGRQAEEQRTLWILGLQCGLVVAASLLGGWFVIRLRLGHTALQSVISFVGGLMLGIGLFHLIPHALRAVGGEADFVMLWTTLGIVAIFFLLRLFHFHHHDPVRVGAESCGPHGGAGAVGPADAVPETSVPPGEAAARRIRWVAVAAGLSLHTLIDGGVLAASVLADADRGLPWWQVGLGPFLAVLLHKPLDSVSVMSLMPDSMVAARTRRLVNLGFALMCPVGAVLFVAGWRFTAGDGHHVLAAMLAFSGGVFLCLSMSDLLPELEMHSHDRLPLSACLLAGIAAAYAITWLEPAHLHG